MTLFNLILPGSPSSIFKLVNLNVRPLSFRPTKLILQVGQAECSTSFFQTHQTESSSWPKLNIQPHSSRLTKLNRPAKLNIRLHSSMVTNLNLQAGWSSSMLKFILQAHQAHSLS